MSHKQLVFHVCDSSPVTPERIKTTSFSLEVSKTRKLCWLSSLLPRWSVRSLSLTTSCQGGIGRMCLPFLRIPLSYRTANPSLHLPPHDPAGLQPEPVPSHSEVGVFGWCPPQRAAPSVLTATSMYSGQGHVGTMQPGHLHCQPGAYSQVQIRY